MNSHIHEQLKEDGIFTIDLCITRESKDKWDLESLLQEALIRDYPHDWILSRQEYFGSEGLEETAECIISTAVIQHWKHKNDPLVYEIELKPDQWMIDAAYDAHYKAMDNYYRIKEELEKQEAARWRGLQSQVENWSGIIEGDTVRIRGGTFGIAKKEGWYDAEDDRHAIPYWTVRLFQGNTIDVKTKHLTKVNLTKEIEK